MSGALERFFKPQVGYTSTPQEKDGFSLTGPAGRHDVGAHAHQGDGSPAGHGALDDVLYMLHNRHDKKKARRAQMPGSRLDMWGRK